MYFWVVCGGLWELEVEEFCSVVWFGLDDEVWKDYDFNVFFSFWWFIIFFSMGVGMWFFCLFVLFEDCDECEFYWNVDNDEIDFDVEYWIDSEGCGVCGYVDLELLKVI